jgi:two-component system cell cycle sensor histidine kinase/response regulator CckA
MLTGFGYEVLPAPDPEEAIVLFRQQRHRIGLLVTDVLMSSMNGCQLAERLRAIEPDLRVLFLSGFPEETLERYHGISLWDTEFLHKPFSPQQLSARVRSLLPLRNVLDRT